MNSNLSEMQVDTPIMGFPPTVVPEQKPMDRERALYIQWTMVLLHGDCRFYSY